MKLNNKSIKIILFLLIFISLSLGIAYASGAFLGGSNEVSLTKGLVGHWKLDEETYDEYTENLAPFTNYSNRNYNTAYSASCWGGDLATIYHYSEGGYNNLPYKKMIKTTGGSGGCYHDNHYGIQIEDNKVYTISAWMKSNISVTVNGYALDINRASDNTYRTGPSISLTTEWKRYSWTYTSGTGHAGIYQARNIIYVDDNLPFEIYWSGFQVEEKPYTTPYVNGIRQSKVTDSTPYENHGITNSGLDVPTFTTDRLENEKSALIFDGSNNYFSTSYVKNINNRITISAWIKPDSSGTYDISNQEQWDGGPWTGWRFRQTSSAITFKLGDGTSNSYSFSAGNLIINEWNYVVGVWNGTHIIIYINGIEAGNSPKSFIYQGNTGRHYIGKYPGSAYYYDGSIDDVRIYNRALSAEEIKLLYDSYRPQTTVASLNRGLVLDMPLTSTWTKSETLGSEVITDKTPYSNDGQNYGATLTNDGTSFSSSQNQYIQTKLKIQDYFNNNDEFTLSFWTKLTATSSVRSGLVNANKYYTEGTAGGFGVMLDQNNRFAPHIGNDQSTSSLYSLNVPINEWQHVLIKYENNNFSFYQNGILIDSLYRNNWLSNNQQIIIGKGSQGGWTSTSDALIQNVRIYNRALTSEEIKLLYDSYKPQTTVASSSSGLVLDMPLTSSWIKTETSGSEIITDKTPYSNNGQNSNAILSNEGASLDGSGTVDGTIPGDNIIIPEDVTNTNNYPNGCTYSIWLYVDTDAVDRMSLFYGASTIRHIEIYSSSKYFRTEAARENGYSFGTSSFPDDVRGKWSHFMIVFANNETNRPVRWYQNGKLFYTGSLDGGSYPGTEYFSFNRLGRSTGTTSYLYAKSFDGKLSNLKIYNKALSDEEVKQAYDLGRY